MLCFSRLTLWSAIRATSLPLYQFGKVVISSVSALGNSTAFYLFSLLLLVSCFGIQITSRVVSPLLRLRYSQVFGNKWLKTKGQIFKAEAWTVSDLSFLFNTKQNLPSSLQAFTTGEAQKQLRKRSVLQLLLNTNKKSLTRRICRIPKTWLCSSFRMQMEKKLKHRRGRGMMVGLTW